MMSQRWHSIFCFIRSLLTDFTFKTLIFLGEIFYKYFTVSNKRIFYILPSFTQYRSSFCYAILRGDLECSKRTVRNNSYYIESYEYTQLSPATLDSEVTPIGLNSVYFSYEVLRPPPHYFIWVKRGRVGEFALTLIALFKTCEHAIICTECFGRNQFVARVANECN